MVVVMVVVVIVAAAASIPIATPRNPRNA